MSRPNRPPSTKNTLWRKGPFEALPRFFAPTAEQLDAVIERLENRLGRVEEDVSQKTCRSFDQHLARIETRLRPVESAYFSKRGTHSGLRDAINALATDTAVRVAALERRVGLLQKELEEERAISRAGLQQTTAEIERMKRTQNHNFRIIQDAINALLGGGS